MVRAVCARYQRGIDRLRRGALCSESAVSGRFIMPVAGVARRVTAGLCSVLEAAAAAMEREDVTPALRQARYFDSHGGYQVETSSASKRRT